jgi:IS5 family transposase
MSTPEGRELRRQWSSKPRKNAGRPMGVPDGHRKETIAPQREKAKIEAEKVVRIMSEKYDIEDEYSKEALQTAVEVMRVDGASRERLQAARLVLDFTKSKPANKSEVTIGKAEDFLASLLADDEKGAEHGSETEEGSQETSN